MKSLLILLIAICAVLASIDDCQHTFKSNGAVYDLRGLEDDTKDYSAQSGHTTYKFNFCRSILSDCTFESVQTGEFNAFGDCIFVNARTTKHSWSPLTDDPRDGVIITHGNGETCYSLPNHPASQSSIKVKCGKTKTEPVVESETDCGVVLSMYSPHGCPTHYSPPSSGGLGFFGWLLILVIISVVGYLTIGIIYKRVTLGTSGVESIPNIDMWRDLGDKFSDLIGRDKNSVNLDEQLLKSGMNANEII